MHYLYYFHKNKGVFPNGTALEKLVYPAYRNIKKNGQCHSAIGVQPLNN